MDKSQFKFTLVDGEVVIDNEVIKIYKKGGFLKEIKEKSWLLFISILIIYKIQKSIFNHDFESTMDYVGFALRLVVALVILLLGIYYAFRYNWLSSIQLNTIETIEFEENNNEIELTLITSNKREKILNFRKLENQVDPFIQVIQKRNSRVKIKNI
ncbi:conserved hypothetical protein [Tenacibaculum sp. 190524A05c]|uniref:hypothetical protein n=1 Tax=Tenacibaculum platacis TaxID=3137852 RepID=UPI0031FAD675